MMVGGKRPRLAPAAALFVFLVASLAMPGRGVAAARDDLPADVDLRIRTLAQRQLEELGIPTRFFPFLADDARVRTGRELFAEPAPDISGGPAPEVLETDLRYSFAIGDGNQDPLRSIETEIDTRISVRDGRTGEKLWSKRFPRDAWPAALRVGDDGDWGVVVISGLWSFYGTTTENVLRFDAFEGKRGKHLWSREYRSLSYWDLATQVSENAPLIIASFDGLKGKADDLMVAFATEVYALFDYTMATRVTVIDGADGSEHLHPIVDLGVNWWPIPLPAGDLDGDGLDDYTTTNNLGVDPGEGQESPSVGGTVYARTGTSGTPIWTTSGIEMREFAVAGKLADVVADPTSDVALLTYVARKDPLPIPLPIPLPVTLPVGVPIEPRVYLMEGSHGSVIWHEKSDWMDSPGDIDRDGKDDVTLGMSRMNREEHWTRTRLWAVDGQKKKLWDRSVRWVYESFPCPRKLCFTWAYWWMDPSPDFEPDSVDDLLLNQFAQQNAALEDSVVHALDARSGEIRFVEEEDPIQAVGVAVDGRGTDLLTYDPRGGDVVLEVRDGWNERIWSGVLDGAEEILPKRFYVYGDGFHLPGDRCGDLVVNAWSEPNSYYAVLSGKDGRELWSRWTGGEGGRLRFVDREGSVAGC